MEGIRKLILAGFQQNPLFFIRKQCFSTCQALLKKKFPWNIEYYYQDKNTYGLYARSGGYVKEAALEAARIAIVRETKNKAVYKIPALVPVTKKGEGSRMGKGKGKVAYHAAVVKPGKILFGFEAENDTIAKKAFKQASFKLPVRTHFRIAPRDEPVVLDGKQLCDVLSGKKLEADFSKTEESHDKLVKEYLERGVLKI